MGLLVGVGVVHGCNVAWRPDHEPYLRSLFPQICFRYEQTMMAL